jgi:catechol 2,3-dioxygenase-like lactoylglutathione lyase family enzyme
MEVEHVAWMVADPAATAAWYVEHLGFQVRRRSQDAAQAHFLADGSGRLALEIYNNPAAALPDYPALDPLNLHLALVSEDVAADRERLVAAGGTAEGEINRTDGGDTVAFVRDPWGLPLQLVRRARPMHRS